MLDASIVQIEAQAADSAVNVAVASCEAALGRGRCVSEQPAGEVSDAWRARVSNTQADSLTWRIEFGAPGDPSSLQFRDIHFIEADGERERWMTVGVVVAAMVVAEQAADQRDITPQFPNEVLQILRRQEPPQQPGVEPPTAPIQPTYGQLAVDMGLAAGWLPDSQRLQFGPQLGVQHRFELPIVVRGQLSYLRGQSSVSALELWEAALGAGAYLRPRAGALSAQASAMLIAERAFVTADDPLSSEEQTQAATRLGAGLDLMAAWHWSDTLALALTARASYKNPQLTLEVRGQNAETIGNFSGSVCISLMASTH